MAKGYAMQGLIDIVNAAGAELVGIGVAVEKGFQGGGDTFRAAGLQHTLLWPSSRRLTPDQHHLPGGRPEYEKGSGAGLRRPV